MNKGGSGGLLSMDIIFLIYAITWMNSKILEVSTHIEYINFIIAADVAYLQEWVVCLVTEI